MTSAQGRPRLASRELLQEAAFELFQLHGYRGTSVAQIAKTAGFSRATFFNFFASKSELFWVETDALIERLRVHLEARSRSVSPVTLDEALLDFAALLASADIPWALQNYRLIEAADDLVASGAGRVLELNRVFAAYLAGANGEVRRAAGSGEMLRVRAEAAAATAKLLVALSTWIDDGVGRGELADYLRATL